MKRNDLIIITIGFAIALMIYIGLQINQRAMESDVKSLEVYIDGVLQDRFSMSDNIERRYETDYGINDIEIVDGLARIVYATCVTQSCIRDGDIDQVN